MAPRARGRSRLPCAAKRHDLVTRLHAQLDISGGKGPLACGELGCFTLEALEAAAGRRGSQDGLGPRNSGRLGGERWYATNKTGQGG